MPIFLNGRQYMNLYLLINTCARNWNKADRFYYKQVEIIHFFNLSRETGQIGMIIRNCVKNE